MHHTPARQSPELIKTTAHISQGWKSKSLPVPGASQVILTSVSTARRQTLEDAKKPDGSPLPNDGQRAWRGRRPPAHTSNVGPAITSRRLPRQEHTFADAPSTADGLPCGPGSCWSQQGWVMTPAVKLHRKTCTRTCKRSGVCVLWVAPTPLLGVTPQPVTNEKMVQSTRASPWFLQLPT